MVFRIIMFQSNGAVGSLKLQGLAGKKTYSLLVRTEHCGLTGKQMEVGLTFLHERAEHLGEDSILTQGCCRIHAVPERHQTDLTLVLGFGLERTDRRGD